MTKHLLFLAVSATLGVTANSFFQIPLFLLIILFFVFLYIRFNGKRKILLVHLINLLLFYATAYASDFLHETVYIGTEKSFQISFMEQPIFDGNLFESKGITEQKEECSASL